MSSEPEVTLRPIGRADIAAVAGFLHRELNPRVAEATWASAMQMPWLAEPPNHGFVLERDGEIVGANLAFYARRHWDGQDVDVVNLGALCVVEGQRHHALRLVRAVLGQRGHEFTDFSPSGNVVELNRRLGFVALDTTTVLTVNLPWPGSRAGILTGPAEIETRLDGDSAQVYRDLRGSGALHHLFIVDGARGCHVALRRDRRKGLPLFVTVVHVSDPELFRRHRRRVFAYALLTLRAPFTLLELRVVRHRPRLAYRLPTARPKMVKTKKIDPESVDYLYSELTELPW